ncbi:MAG: hypothetical protein V2I38_00845 [Alcanivoracaceae bacterium]|jgi:hypothetical protein|nr:hypothetical protein [Alcanivoracaceae bacterium]
MSTIQRRLPVLAISAMALALTGCGGSSNDSEGGILGSAKAAAQLGSHEDVLARAILAMDIAPDLRYGAQEIAGRVGFTTSEFGPEEESPATNTVECPIDGDATGSGSITVALDTVTKVPSQVPEELLPEGEIAFPRSTVTLNNCLEVYVEEDEDGVDTNTYQANGRLRVVTPGALDIGFVRELLVEVPVDAQWTFVSAENFTEVRIEEDSDSDLFEYRSSLNGAVVLVEPEGFADRALEGPVFVTEDLIGSLQLSERFAAVEGENTAKGEFAVALLDVAKGQPSVVSSYDGDLIDGHFRLGVDSSFEEQSLEGTFSQECRLPGAFTVEITTPISYEGDPISGEMTLSSAGSSAGVAINSGEVTITIDGVAETFDVEDEAFYIAETKARTCRGEGGPRF